jgi:hypothetical protein
MPPHTMPPTLHALLIAFQCIGVLCVRLSVCGGTGALGWHQLLRKVVARGEPAPALVGAFVVCGGAA